ncbi:50S ribosomal protein L25/general stress protein Ctc [Diaphorobacter aerolatus]|uniref:Large ribosomal subunit protein bL25 n=1 Tax=Diaphorobacter aerolatus TaxID=1288495 RepID=A0A7H0GIB4_9BURK|nr:50S ribosomal protein L25/general stress protein Ctc [Diaphorobacter aerolatus]QNP48030.1 50S ribosomal protein L25/general stress protein Ctc [Diaphorobacter aerolatus]
MKFVAFERAKQGTGASRRLRISGRTPGIVYGGEGQPQLVELDHNNLWHALKKEAFHASVLDMEVDGKAGKVLLRDVQFHPYKQLVLHVDFQRVDAKTKLHMKVPLHFNGAEESDAVKVDKCLVTILVNELEVTCLPKDLPEFVEVDLSGLQKNAPLHISDVKLPKGVTLVQRGNKSDPALLSVNLPPEEEVEEVAPAAEGDAAAAAAAPAADAKKKK